MLVGAVGTLAGGGGVSVWDSTIPAASRSLAPWRNPRLKTAVSVALSIQRSIAELPVKNRAADCFPGLIVA